MKKNGRAAPLLKNCGEHCKGTKRQETFTFKIRMGLPSQLSHVFFRTFSFRPRHEYVRFSGHSLSALGTSMPVHTSKEFPLGHRGVYAQGCR
jgi:hypothetical protein